MARKLAFDRLLFATVVLLTGLGLVMVYSSSAALVQREGLVSNSLFVKQCIIAGLGLITMLAVMHIDYRWLKRPPVMYAGIATVLTLLVAVLFAPEINNSRRWFVVGGLSIQPSEIAKLALIPYIAYQIDRKRDRLSSYVFLLPVAGMTALMAGLILLGKDLGTTIILCVPALVMLFLAGIPMAYIFAGAAVAIPSAAAAILAQPYRLKRLTAFLNPEDDPLGKGFQILQSLIAVGSGGLFGLGPGNSVQKLHFLPSPHADFIFSIVAEEFGFFGSAVFVGLFAVVLWRGVRAGLAAPDLFGRYLCWGFVCLIIFQALTHMSVALGLMPTTGLPLPFISHGGSSLLTSMVAAGLILNVSQHG